MSRTIRRKGAYNLSYYVTPVDKIDRYDLDRHDTDSAQVCVQKQKAWFHRDHGPGTWRPPSWYCHELNNRIKRQNCAELHRCLAHDEWDDHLPVPFRRDAGYNWW